MQAFLRVTESYHARRATGAPGRSDIGVPGSSGRPTVPRVIDRLAWVTTRAVRGHDDDEPLALAAFTAAGVHVDVVDWDDPAVRWGSYDRVFLRSTWDYSARLAEFRHWLDVIDAAAQVVNPVPLVRWNLDKHYLAELAGAGVPTIPTVFVEPGDVPALPDAGFVVKPAVGAGSRDVAAYRPDQHADARGHVGRLHARGATAMVQPLLESVPVHGEWPLIFFGGHYSHAANKRITLPPVGGAQLSATKVNSAHTADAAQLAAARAAIEAVSARVGPPTYARVDLVRDDLSGDDRGRYLVLELELVEPSLFLPQGGPDAVERLVGALAS